jgi:hypothetical protein
MTDLGGFDARATVVSSVREQEAVFARHRARIQEIDWTIHNPRLLMQDTNPRLSEWFASRVDARWALRRVLAS